MRVQAHQNLIVDVGPVRMVVHLLGLQRDAGYEPERADEVSKFERPTDRRDIRIDGPPRQFRVHVLYGRVLRHRLIATLQSLSHGRMNKIAQHPYGNEEPMFFYNGEPSRVKCIVPSGFMPVPFDIDELKETESSKIASGDDLRMREPLERKNDKKCRLCVI